MHFSGTSIFGSSKMNDDRKQVYAKGYKVSVKEADKALEGTIVNFDVQTAPIEVRGLELEIQQPRIKAPIRTSDGQTHYVDTKNEGFERIVQPEELPMAKD